jgi:transcriptional regulator with XRE-family HTH domain
MALALSTAPASVGDLLRQWRQHRRLSQLALASEAGVSPRHLSFVETGRARPSRELIVHLAVHLDVPLRRRNELLLAAGFAPAYPDAGRGLEAAALDGVRASLQALLDAHDPYPSLVVDRLWNLVLANASAAALLEGIDEDLLAPPLNVLRLSLHPRGLAPAIVNLPAYRATILARLRRDVQRTADGELAALLTELEGYGTDGDDPAPDPGVVVPLRLRRGDRVLSFFTVAAKLGGALDVTLDEVDIETFLPADAETRAYLARGGGGR